MYMSDIIAKKIDEAYATTVEELEQQLRSIRKNRGIITKIKEIEYKAYNTYVIDNFLFINMTESMEQFEENKMEPLTVEGLLGWIDYERDGWKDIGSNEDDFDEMSVIVYLGTDCSDDYTDHTNPEKFLPLLNIEKSGNQLLLITGYEEEDEENNEEENKETIVKIEAESKEELKKQRFNIPVSWIEKKHGYIPIDATSKEEAMALIKTLSISTYAEVESEEHELIQLDGEIINHDYSLHRISIGRAFLQKIFEETMDYEDVDLTKEEWSEIDAAVDEDDYDFEDVERILNKKLIDFGYDWNKERFKWVK